MRIPSILFLSVPVFTQKAREPNQVSKPGESVFKYLLPVPILTRYSYRFIDSSAYVPPLQN